MGSIRLIVEPIGPHVMSHRRAGTWSARCRLVVAAVAAFGALSLTGAWVALSHRPGPALSQVTASSSEPASASSPPPAGPAARGCSAVTLPRTLAAARSGGASIMMARGVLTGRTVPGEGYHELRWDSARTLAGPALPARGTGWIYAPQRSPDPAPGTDAGALWALDGWLFAIVAPRVPAATTVGPTLRIAPVVDGQVVLSSAGCWDVSGLPTRPFTGPLAEVPGSGSYARAAAGRLLGVPLALVERYARGS